MHGPVPRPIYPHADIVRAVAAAMGCSVDDLKRQRHPANAIVYARQAAAWMMRTYCRPVPTYRVIAERLGLKDHATTHHACKAVEAKPERYEAVIDGAVQWLVAAQRSPLSRAVALAMQEHPGDPDAFLARLRGMGYVLKPECEHDG